ncbi:hypothetical protein ACIQMR_32590 [Streptomyces sp. NPDC091376]|uniref:hypothetical protein n=1 Tax=Streptomyces sp. NPDC091376 TaxID=3365994 RepID=UPI003818B787
MEDADGAVAELAKGGVVVQVPGSLLVVVAAGAGRDRQCAERLTLQGVREAERAELERLRREMSEKDTRIRELEMERDVLKRCMVLWAK